MKRFKKVGIFILACTVALTSFGINSFKVQADSAANITENNDVRLSKNVTLSGNTDGDWDNRIYDINLTAVAKNQTITTTSGPADIILVLDRSGSMKDELDDAYMPINREPSRRNTYYIFDAEGNVHQLYREGPKGNKYWCYKIGEIVIPVTYEQGGTGADNKYQFYVKASKQQALISSANNFVDTVKEKSPDSRIGVVEFSDNYNNANIIATRNDNNLLRVGNEESYTTITDAISNLPAEGSTAADNGLSKAKEIFDGNKFEEVDQKENRRKIVIFFTDGEPNHYSGWDPDVAKDTISIANTLKGDPYNATVYSIGVFSGLTGDNLTRVEDYMKAVASNKLGSTTGEKLYTKVNNSSELDDIFQSITEEVEGNIKTLSIKDYIDPNFQVLDDNGIVISQDDCPVELASEGKVYFDSSKNSYYVEWTLDELTSTTWNQTIKVKAKDSFVGGNDITTNETGSGIYYGDSSYLSFAQPKVNVKVKFNVLPKTETIFLGETVPTAGLNDSMFNVEKYNYTDDGNLTGSFSTQWKKGTEVISNLGSEKPEVDTDYTLEVTFTPNNSVDANATANSGGRVAETTTLFGNYKVIVKSGTIVIRKLVTGESGDALPTDDYFTIKLRATDGGNKEVDADLVKDGKLAITKLSKGTYTVQEILPKEYELLKVSIDGVEYTDNEAKKIDINKDNPEVVVIYTNKYTPKGYYHSDDRVENAFEQGISK